ALIVKGRILAKAPPDQLKKSLGFEPEAVVKAVCNGREEAISRRGGGEALVELVKKAAEEGCTVLEAYVREPPLEEVVVKTIGGV
ncbi:MAG: ABC transporter ATP-binding protein, partial [Thermoproteus sp.]